MPRAAECLRSFSFSEIRARFPRFSAGNPTENGRSASARSETAYRPPAQRPGEAAHSAARAACRCRASRRDTAPALPQGPAQILRKVDILFAAGNAVQQQHGGMQSFAACRIQHGQQPSASAVQQDTVHIRPVRAVSVMCLTASYFFLHKGCSPSASAAAQLFSHYSYRVSMFIWIIPPCAEIARKIYSQIAPVP